MGKIAKRPVDSERRTASSDGDDRAIQRRSFLKLIGTVGSFGGMTSPAAADHDTTTTHEPVVVHREPVEGTVKELESYLRTNGLKSPFAVLEPDVWPNRRTTTMPPSRRTPATALTLIYYDETLVGGAGGLLYPDRIGWDDFTFDLEPVTVGDETGWVITNLQPVVPLSTKSAISMIDWQSSCPLDSECEQAWSTWESEALWHEKTHITFNELMVREFNNQWASAAKTGVATVDGASEADARSKAPNAIRDSFESLYTEWLFTRLKPLHELLHDVDNFEDPLTGVILHRWTIDWLTLQEACSTTPERLQNVTKWKFQWKERNELNRGEDTCGPYRDDMSIVTTGEGILNQERPGTGRASGEVNYTTDYYTARYDWNQGCKLSEREGEGAGTDGVTLRLATDTGKYTIWGVDYEVSGIQRGFDCDGGVTSTREFSTGAGGAIVSGEVGQCGEIIHGTYDKPLSCGSRLHVSWTLTPIEEAETSPDGDTN